MVNPESMTKFKSNDIFHIFLFFATIIIFIFSIFASISGYIRPHHFKFISLTNNLLPITLGALSILLIIWLIRKRWVFIFPLIGIAVNINTIFSIIQPRVEREPFAAALNSSIKVISFNVHDFNYSKSYDEVAEINEFINSEKPDILCIQEFETPGYLNDNEMHSYFSHFSAKYIEKTTQEKLGLAIMSVYNISDKGVVDFEGTSNRIIWADLITDRGKIRVINCHLQTTGLARASKNGTNFLKRINELMENNKIRATQAEAVKVIINSTPFPVVVCGDFNDTPSSYTYTTIKGENMTDGFRQAGSGFAGTYKGISGLFRIDYVFHSDHFRSIRYRTPETNHSDHKPVISELVYKN